MLQGRVQGMSGRDLRERVDELLELVGIADAADRIVKTLLGRHAAPARHRARPRPPAARALPRRADDRPRPGGARRDVGRGRAARRGRDADDPAHDALPRGGRPARRPARDRLAGQDRRRGHAGRAEGGPARRRRARRARRTARSTRRSGCSRASARGRSRCSTGARRRRASPNGGRGAAGDPLRARERRHRGRVGLALAARRSTTSTSTTPAATSARRIAASDRSLPPHLVHDRAPGAQPDARADLDRAAARAADGLARPLRAALPQRDAARRLRHRARTSRSSRRRSSS